MRVEPRDGFPGILLSSVQFSVIATAGIVPPSLEQEKSFPALGRGREARGHGPPKPFSLSIINSTTALLTPSSHATAPTGCAIAHLPCPTPAQLSIPTRGSAARLAPLRKLPAVILAVAVCPVQAANRPAYQRQFISIPSTPNPIVSPHSAAALLKWPVSILVSSCFALLSLYTRKYGFFIRLNIGSEIDHLGT